MSCVVKDFKNDCGKWVKSYREGGTSFYTKSYTIWRQMNLRCSVGSHAQKVNPSYMDCEVSDYFKNFQNFANWYTTQVGFDKGYVLDKDLLYHNNKLYSEDTCVLIPYQLNSFLVTSKSRKNSELALGVSYDKTKKLFKAAISIDNKNIYLGRYLTLDEAASAYRAAKTKEGRRWHQRLLEGEFDVCQKVIDRMATWSR